MAEIQENPKMSAGTIVETSPQFVLWVPEERLFRPAKLIQPDNYIGYDLSRNTRVVPNAEGLHLRLIEAPYLGPVSFVDESYTSNIIKKSFEAMRWEGKGRLRTIVERAEAVAKSQKFPYFSVTVLETTETEPEKEMTELKYISLSLEEKMSFNGDKLLGRDTRKITRILHPTAQLYVPQD